MSNSEKQEVILEMQGITKRFPGVIALDNVQFDLRKGECHALLGENGAGKSTIMKILGGVYSLDEGTIKLRGEMHEFKNTMQSQMAGIGFIHQELNLVKELSVAENIYLGREPLLNKQMTLLNHKQLNADAQKVLDSINMKFKPTDKVGSLSIAHQQMVELAKALSLDAHIIIMDEPTSSLTDREVAELFRMVRILKEQGKSVVYISHRMDEIKEISDRVTVFRDGHYIGTKATESISVDEIINMMVGRSLTDQFPSRDCKIGEVVLKAEHISRKGVLDDVSLDVRAGEILGMVGLVGSGRTETVRCITGADRMDSGRVVVDGKELNVRSPIDAIVGGICLIPEERKAQGLVLGFSVQDNILLPLAKKLSKLCVINHRGIKKMTEDQVKALRIKTPNIQQKVKFLSGGNQQKVVLAKWMTSKFRVFIFDEPTRGIDVGAKYEIYKLMNQLVEAGNAVIMISSEMPEVLGMSDRIAVMCMGRKTGELSVSEATQERIMALATGTTIQQAV
ncbi:MAG: sugar ABC transporter ATP-binding protein [Spartobacteria bacterium]|nr:sugar ABC transporter ATP-binding protein [Spartobacteria bacterium]